MENRVENCVHIGHICYISIKLCRYTFRIGDHPHERFQGSDGHDLPYNVLIVDPATTQIVSGASLEDSQVEIAGLDVGNRDLIVNFINDGSGHVGDTGSHMGGGVSRYSTLYIGIWVRTAHQH